MRKKKVLRTSNREIYEKFNLLNFSPSIILENSTKKDLGKLIKNINRDEKVLEIEPIKDKFIIRKKKSSLGFNIYLK